MRQFLLAMCGAASFWEKGFVGKEVPHAHMHGLPVDVPSPVEWVSGGKLLPVNSWADVRLHRERAEGYTFVSGASGRYIALDRAFVLDAARRATIARTGQTLDPATGGLRRGGKEEVEMTRHLWTTWATQASVSRTEAAV
jgi:hypothetical protein